MVSDTVDAAQASSPAQLAHHALSWPPSNELSSLILLILFTPSFVHVKPRQCSRAGTLTAKTIAMSRVMRATTRNGGSDHFDINLIWLDSYALTPSRSGVCRPPLLELSVTNAQSKVTVVSSSSRKCSQSASASNAARAKRCCTTPPCPF